MQITLGDLNFIFQFSTIPLILNKKVPTSFLHLSELKKIGTFKPSKGPFLATGIKPFDIRSIICFVDMIYSLTMSSFPLDLLSFKVLSDSFISDSIIGSFKTCDLLFTFTQF